MADGPRDSPALPAEERYYAAQELDQFPRLAAPLPFDAPVSRADPARRMRLELSIDATGTVTRVVTPERGAAAVTARWRSARFEPARKSGRAVASRVEIEVEY